MQTEQNGAHGIKVGQAQTSRSLRVKSQTEHNGAHGIKVGSGTNIAVVASQMSQTGQHVSCDENLRRST